ncbi:MAG: FmdB family zinc ribbon protein [Candidatus Dormibacteria bacterium]
MPNYGYRCQACQREFEVLQRMADPPQAECPDCGGTGTRLFYATGILFKGSGFYKTDSRSTAAATSPSSTEAPRSGQDGSADPAKPALPAKDAGPPPSAPATPPSPPPAKPPATG